MAPPVPSTTPHTELVKLWCWAWATCMYCVYAHSARILVQHMSCTASLLNYIVQRTTYSIWCSANLGVNITVTPDEMRKTLDMQFGYFMEPVNGHKFPICIGETGSAFIKLPLPQPPARPTLCHGLLSVRHNSSSTLLPAMLCNEGIKKAEGMHNQKHQMLSINH